MDTQVFLIGIFQFLRTFSFVEPNFELSFPKLAEIDLKRIASFRYGLIYFFAALMLNLETNTEQDSPSDSSEQQTTDACIQSLTSMIPPELSIKQLTKLTDPSDR